MIHEIFQRMDEDSLLVHVTTQEEVDVMWDLLRPLVTRKGGLTRSNGLRFPLWYVAYDFSGNSHLEGRATNRNNLDVVEAADILSELHSVCMNVYDVDALL